MGLFPSLIAINDLPAKECPDLQGQIPEQKEAGAWGCILLRDSLCVFSCSSWNEMDVAWDEMRQPSQNLGVSQSRAWDFAPAGDFLAIKYCPSLQGRCFSASNSHSYGSWGVKHNPGMLCRAENLPGDHMQMER